MAMTATRVASVATAGAGPTFITSTFTPVANRLYLISVRAAGTSIAVTAITSTCGLTPIQVADVSTSTIVRKLYRDLELTGLLAGAVSVTLSGVVTTCIVTVDELQGADTTGTHGSGAIVQSSTGNGNNGTSSSLSPALSAITSPDGVFSSCGLNASKTITQPTSFTDLGSTTDGSLASLETAFQDASSATNPSHTWSGSQQWRQISAEIKASSSAPVWTVNPAVTGNLQGGQTLTCDGGTATGVNGTITKTYQWQRALTAPGSWGAFANIGGATGSTYTLLTSTDPDVKDKFQCVVTATDSNGATSATSNVVGPVGYAYAPGMNTAIILVCANSMGAVYTRPAVATGAVLGGEHGLNRVFIGLNR